MPQIGDIVAIASKPRTGFWTVLERVSSGHWRCRQDFGRRGGAVNFDAAPGDIEVLLTPALSPGDELKLNGKRVVVLALLGNTVKVELAAEDRREPLPFGGTVAFGVGSAVVGKGELVSENASQLFAGTDRSLTMIKLYGKELRVPVDLNEGFFDAIRKDKVFGGAMSDGIAARFKDASARMRQNAIAALDLANSCIGVATWQARAARERFPENFQKLRDAADKAIHEAMRAGLEENHRLQKKVSPPTPADKVKANQARDRLWELRHDEAKRDAAFAGCSAETLFAIFDAEPWASGLSPTVIETRRMKWQNDTYPDEMRQLSELGKFLHTAARQSRSYENFFNELERATAAPSMDEPTRRIEAAQQAVAAAVAAE